MSDDRLNWFKSQVGKTIWRTKTSCDCVICESVYTNGIHVLNEEHAIFIYVFEDDRVVDRYFATKEERNEFEKTKL